MAILLRICRRFCEFKRVSFINQSRDINLIEGRKISRVLSNEVAFGRIFHAARGVITSHHFPILSTLRI